MVTRLVMLLAAAFLVGWCFAAIGWTTETWQFWCIVVPPVVVVSFIVGRKL